MAVTNGSWTKYLSKLTAALITYGVQSIKITILWRFWFRKKRNKRSALKFLRKLLKSSPSPNRITTDKLRSYSAAIKATGSSVPHDTNQYRNNIVEISHQPTRQRERQMRKFNPLAKRNAS